jgi:hypothetical protein
MVANSVNMLKAIRVYILNGYDVISQQSYYNEAIYKVNRVKTTKYNPICGEKPLTPALCPSIFLKTFLANFSFSTFTYLKKQNKILQSCMRSIYSYYDIDTQ